MNPFHWIVRNRRINQVIGIGGYILLGLGHIPFRGRINQDLYMTLYSAATWYLCTWVILTIIANYLYAPERLVNGIPFRQRLIYGVGAAMIILVIAYLMNHVR